MYLLRLVPLLLLFEALDHAVFEELHQDEVHVPCAAGAAGLWRSGAGREGEGAGWREAAAGGEG